MLTLRPRTSGLAVPKQALGRGIERLNQSVCVDDDDPIDRRFDDGSPARLARSQLLLEIHARTEIVHHSREFACAAHRHLADRQMKREDRPVATAAADFTADADDVCRSGGEITRQVAIVFFVVRRRHQDVDVLTDDLRRRVAKQAFGSAIERFDSGSVVDDDDPVDGRIDHRAKAFVRVLQVSGAAGG